MSDIANILVGVAKLYIGPEGETEPDITGGSITWAGSWKEFGFSEDGVAVEYTPEFFDAVIDQALTPVKRVLTAESLIVRVGLAEADLDRLALAIAGAAFSQISAGSGQSGQDVVKIGGGAAVIKKLGFEGKSPEGGFRVMFVHRVNSIEAVAQSYKKGEKTIFPVAFAALADLSKAAGEQLCQINDWTEAAT